MIANLTNASALRDWRFTSLCRVDIHVMSECSWYALIGLCHHRPLARYIELRVAHAVGMPGTYSPPPRVSDPDMHHGKCATHVPWYMLGSLTIGFLVNRWWEKRSRHSQHMHNPQFYVSGKRPMDCAIHIWRERKQRKHFELPLSFVKINFRTIVHTVIS